MCVRVPAQRRAFTASGGRTHQLLAEETARDGPPHLPADMCVLSPSPVASPTTQTHTHTHNSAKRRLSLWTRHVAPLAAVPPPSPMDVGCGSSLCVCVFHLCLVRFQHASVRFPVFRVCVCVPRSLVRFALSLCVYAPRASSTALPFFPLLPPPPKRCCVRVRGTALPLPCFCVPCSAPNPSLSEVPLLSLPSFPHPGPRYRNASSTRALPAPPWPTSCILRCRWCTSPSSSSSHEVSGAVRTHSGSSGADLRRPATSPHPARRPTLPRSHCAVGLCSSRCVVYVHPRRGLPCVCVGRGLVRPWICCLWVRIASDAERPPSSFSLIYIWLPFSSILAVQDLVEMWADVCACVFVCRADGLLRLLAPPTSSPLPPPPRTHTHSHRVRPAPRVADASFSLFQRARKHAFPAFLSLQHFPFACLCVCVCTCMCVAFTPPVPNVPVQSVRPPSLPPSLRLVPAVVVHACVGVPREKHLWLSSPPCLPHRAWLAGALRLPRSPAPSPIDLHPFSIAATPPLGARH